MDYYTKDNALRVVLDHSAASSVNTLSMENQRLRKENEDLKKKNQCLTNKIGVALKTLDALVPTH